MDLDDSEEDNMPHFTSELEEIRKRDLKQKAKDANMDADSDYEDVNEDKDDHPS